MNGTKREKMLLHGLKLQRIFPQTKHSGPVSLYQAIRRLENEAHRLAEQECNQHMPEGYVESRHERILNLLDARLGFRREGIPVFINSDPRGYALKIDDKYVRNHELDIHTDWGGYGILAPEF